MTRGVLAIVAALSILPVLPILPADRVEREFDVAETGDALITVIAGCARCDWGETGREAAVLRVSLDGEYSQHVVIARGETAVEYPIALGRVAKGRHRLTIDRDTDLSARGAGPATIDTSEVTVRHPGDADFQALSLAPIIYARANTVGKFTDVPMLMWYEVETTPRGTRYRYSVVFSNEDGGTETDRLMATWGRTTDIEFVYGVELDGSGRILAEEFQGPGHEVPAFTGRHEAGHPLLWVSTDNNMVSESGSTRIRYAPAAEKFDLANQSREAVMDAHPWTYAVSSVEMRREGKTADDPPPGHNTIPDPRRFVYVEACGTIGDAAIALSIGTAGQSKGEMTWTPSDRGLPRYRVVRDGCFRIATPVPRGTRPADLRAIRVNAYERPRPNNAPPARPAGPVTMTRINKVFMLDAHDLPGPSVFRWTGAATLRPGGEPLEVRIP